MPSSQTASRSFVRSAMQAPYLDREEEQALAIRWRQAGDQEALHRLTQSHMRLVIAVAARFRSFGLPMPDLVQEGHVGLLEAAARFEPERQVRFSTYATWWIRASIQDYILRNWSIVRGGTSSNQKALFFNLRRLRAKLSAGSEAVRDDEIHRQIATALGVSQSDVALMAARISGPDTPLSAPVGDGEGAERQDFLVCEQPRPDEIVETEIDSARRVSWLREAMGTLSAREMQILAERRLSEEGATLESIGERLGISKERVRQIENRALEKLKAVLVSRHPELAVH